MSTVAADVDAIRRVGTEVRGPTALGNDPRRVLTLAWALAITDFRLKFFGSALGYLWQLMRPLMLFGVLYLVFSTVLKVGDEVPFYPVALLLGVVLYSFFSEATQRSVRSIVERENLVRKIEFPRVAVPLAVLVTALMNLGLNLVPVFVFLVIAGGSPHWGWLELPFLVAFLAVFVLGLSLLLSSLFVRYRDIEPIWDVVLQILFYASAVFFPLELLFQRDLGWVAHVMACNPFTAVLQQARHAIVDPQHMSLTDALGSDWLLLVPVAITVVTLVLGFAVFSREAPRIAEDL